MSPSCSTSSPTLGVVSLLKCSYPNGCKMVSYCVFYLHFLNDSWYWASFYVLFGHPYIFLCEMFVRVFCPFKKLSIFIVGLYEFFTYSVRHTYLNTFSQSVACLFTFWTVYFDVQSFYFDEIQFTTFLRPVIFALCLRNLFQFQGRKDILCFLLEASYFELLHLAQ